MSGRLAFQSQLASIMEVLANAAVAEICRLVEDEYAVVQLQMSQCQRENKALKRKLHLLEIKMARGNAERRLRDSAMHSSRPRLQVPGIDRLRGTGAGAATTCTDGTFGTQMDLIQWSGRGSAGDTDQMQSDSTYSKSPDVQLVEPQAAKVKEEQVEANTSRVKETQEDLEIIRDDGVVERVLSAPPGPRPSLEQQETQCLPGQNQHLNQEQSVRRTRASSRGVEKEEEDQEEGDVVLVKVEEVEELRTATQTGLSIQEGVVESSTDDFRAALAFDDVTHASTHHLCDPQESGRGLSEPPAPQSDPVMSHHQRRVEAIQQTLPDTNAESERGTPLSSEYSLFDLETFFTRWAPDSDSVAHPEPGPRTSRSLDNEDPAESDLDAVIVVESDVYTQPDLQPTQESTGRTSRVHIQLAAPPARPAASVLRRTQASSQPPWSRPSSLLRITQNHPSRTSAPSNSGGVSSTLSAALPVSPAAVERRRKNYVCRACGKAFSGLSNLEAHERVHTGERPFSCSTCGKRFSEAGNLRKHQRVHTGEKPYSCQFCGKTFAWICNLRTHQQSASGCSSQALNTSASYT